MTQISDLRSHQADRFLHISFCICRSEGRFLRISFKTRCFTHTDPTYKLEPGVENRFFVVKYLSIIDTTSEEARATVARASSEVVSIMLQPLANASVSPRLTFEAFETLHA